jgi:hypothetical protein
MMKDAAGYVLSNVHEVARPAVNGGRRQWCLACDCYEAARHAPDVRGRRGCLSAKLSSLVVSYRATLDEDEIYLGQ